MENNYHEEEIEFINKKIREVRVALFKSEVNSELELPNNIIQVLKTQSDGTIWFFTSCSGKQADSMDRSFYAYLDFYRKGTGCKLQISGKAVIADDEKDEFDMSDYSSGTAANILLVKMKIMQAEYFENKPHENVSWVEWIKSTFNHLFLTDQHRVYDFS